MNGTLAAFGTGVLLGAVMTWLVERGAASLNRRLCLRAWKLLADAHEKISRLKQRLAEKNGRAP